MTDRPELTFPPDGVWTISEWLDVQTQLQVVGKKGDPLEIEDREQLRDFVTWNALAACAELHEMADEMGWKPWDDNRGLISADQRIRAIMEGVDAMHFLANLFRALNATGEEITAAYRAKAEKNLKRWQEGYDARESKCPGCHRDFTETTCVSGEFCEEVGHEVQNEGFQSP